MSPLACSLLALAALFAATDALFPNPYCSFLEMGKTDGYPQDNEVDFTITVAGGYITIPDRCTRPGNKLVGQSISVCNAPNSKPEIIVPLRTDYRRPNFGSLYIHCPSGFPGCDRLEVHVWQYCEMVIM
ncbi:uncharacterized protein LOC134740883 [Cydia strobilella]|uniref:uncharacterized protein LOC134740883 n=1 Tax=Cydia strobilella TaxID=1100964 RepID=UPI003004A36D